MSRLPQAIANWQEQGEIARVDGVDLFYRIGGNATAELPWLVCFHGFPTSSWDWHLLLPYLDRTHRVLLFDFPGYGLSAKPPNRDYALARQFDAAAALLRHLGIDRFDLLAHDMGDSVACELLRRRERGDCPLDLTSLTLLNGSVYMEMARPLLTQKLLRTPGVGAVAGRLMSYRLFRRQYPNVYANPAQWNEEHYRAQWALITGNGGRRVMHRIAAYMNERVSMGPAWTGPLERCDVPLRVIWGDRDPIAVYAIAERLARENPKAELVTLEGAGHYPQLEVPAQVAAALQEPGCAR